MGLNFLFCRNGGISKTLCSIGVGGLVKFSVLQEWAGFGSTFCGSMWDQFFYFAGLDGIDQSFCSVGLHSSVLCAGVGRVSQRFSGRMWDWSHFLFYRSGWAR